MAPSLTERNESVVWILVGILITVTVVFVLSAFVGAIVLGIFLYYATRPIYRSVNDRIDHPSISATFTLLTVGLPILLILAYAAFVGIREFEQFLSVAGLQELRTTLEPYTGFLSGGNGKGPVSVIRANISQVGGFAAAVTTWLLRLFVIFTLAFYLLRDDQKIARWFYRSFEDRPSAVTFMENVDDDLTTIYTGNLITIVATGIIAVVVFSALDFAAPAETGIQFPILLGLLTGVGTIVPAIGMKVIYYPFTGYLLWQSIFRGGGPLWFPIVFFVVTVIAVDTIPDFFIRSYVSKGDLNMGLMLLTYTLGAVAFGWYGIFFAPIILVLFLHFLRDILPVLVAADTTIS
jgi:predicted PurR-regulated permease PerM